MNPLHVSAVVTHDCRLTAATPDVPLHACVGQNHGNMSREDAFSNLLYDMSCNVAVPPTPPRDASMPMMEHGMSMMSMAQRTPQMSSRGPGGRLFPRTNPAFGRTGQTSIFTMPRLSAGGSASKKPVMLLDPASAQLHRRSAQQFHCPPEKNGNGNWAFSSPDTEQTDEDSSGADDEEEDEEEEETTKPAEEVPPPAFPNRRADELFALHSDFSNLVDECPYTRDSPPPVPPPRLASAAGTLMTPSMGPRAIIQNSSTWQVI